MLVAARLGNTRLLDNIAVDVGTRASTDGREPAATNVEHELPWRN
jgi:pantoate--beta-alanine ligase